LIGEQKSLGTKGMGRRISGTIFVCFANEAQSRSGKEGIHKEAIVKMAVRSITLI